MQSLANFHPTYVRSLRGAARGFCALSRLHLATDDHTGHKSACDMLSYVSRETLLFRHLEQIMPCSGETSLATASRPPCSASWTATSIRRRRQTLAVGFHWI